VLLSSWRGNSEACSSNYPRNLTVLHTKVIFPGLADNGRSARVPELIFLADSAIRTLR
jgi:hypothetical protein